MRKIFIVFVLLTLVVLVIFAIDKNKTDLPDTFSIHFVNDNTSSGGDRNTTADLKYSSSILVEGIATYIAHPNGGGEINYSCTYTNGKWVNTNDRSIFAANADDISNQFLKDAIKNCTHLPQYPVTVEELQTKIKNKDIKPEGETCGHGSICYRINK